jgi:hypothetical protein
MPYWGIALAYGFHLNLDMDKDVHSGPAFDAIQRALTRSAHAPRYEQDYVAALARGCSGDSHADEAKLSLDYKNPTAELVAQVSRRHRCSHTVCGKFDGHGSL